MSNFNLKSDWLSALNEVFGARIGSEITQGEAERMFFPFYDKIDNSQFLRRHGEEIAHVVLYGDERCVYKVIDADQYDTYLSLNFVGVEIGELTELGCVPIDNGGSGLLLFQPETSRQVDFFNGALQFTVISNKVSTNEIKLFGDKVYFKYTPTDEMDSGRIVVYAKYKPHGLSFEFLLDQTSDHYRYFIPYIVSGYKLVSCIIRPSVIGNYSFYLYKKAAGDTGNDTRLANASTATITDFNEYKIPLTGTGAGLSTHYRDVYFGGTGTASASSSYKPYQARLTFQKIS